MCVTHGDASQVREEGGEVEDAHEWWARMDEEVRAAWAEGVQEQLAVDEERRQLAKKAAADAEARAAAAAAARIEAEENEAAKRRKETLRANRALAAAHAAARERGAPPAAPLDRVIGAVAAREAAASAARANPPPPMRVDSPTRGGVGGGTPARNGAGADSVAADVGSLSLKDSGYWFEDAGEMVKVSVPLSELCAAGAPPLDCATAAFSDYSLRLEVTLGTDMHVLSLPQLAYDIEPDRCTCKVRTTLPITPHGGSITHPAR